MLGVAYTAIRMDYYTNHFYGTGGHPVQTFLDSADVGSGFSISSLADANNPAGSLA